MSDTCEEYVLLKKGSCPNEYFNKLKCTSSFIYDGEINDHSGLLFG